MFGEDLQLCPVHRFAWSRHAICWFNLVDIAPSVGHLEDFAPPLVLDLLPPLWVTPQQYPLSYANAGRINLLPAVVNLLSSCCCCFQLPQCLAVGFPQAVLVLRQPLTTVGCGILARWEQQIRWQLGINPKEKVIGRVPLPLPITLWVVWCAPRLLNTVHLAQLLYNLCLE